MYVRVSTVNKGQRAYQYLQIVEAYRDNGRPRQRVVATLGRLDQLGEKVDQLVCSLSNYCKRPRLAPDQITCREALAWGPVLVARHLWEQVGLGEIIGRLCRRRKFASQVTEQAFVLVANRLTAPSSEHGLARWLENTFVCDRRGRRFKPQWRPVRQITKAQRVKVQSRQLNRWYHTLDALLAVKDQLEQQLFGRVRDLFSQKVDLVFYDLTSTYFCRKSPAGTLRRHGASKDHRPRQVQVVLGVVMANGWPIAHHVFAGNQAEKTTLLEVLKDLESRFGLGRILVVGDRGLVSADNLRGLAQTSFRYLAGIPGRQNREAAAVLQSLAAGRWIRIDPGNRVQEVCLPDRSSRYFVVDSADRKIYEEALRQRAMGRVREALERIEKAVKNGRLKDPVKIAARAAKTLSKNHGHRYYRYDVPGPGRFRFDQDEKKLSAETLHEGKYVLKTDDEQIDAESAVRAYKELATVESGFRDLKDIIEMRPIYHHKDDRIRAHILVASLALFLKRTLEHQLCKTLPQVSGTDALAAVRSIGLSELQIEGRTIRLVAQGGRDARRIIAALGIADLNPPGSQTLRGSPKTAM